MKPHVRRYTELIAAAPSNVRRLPSERLHVFAVLRVARRDSEFAWLTSSEVADVLCEVEGLNVPRQRVLAILSAERQAVAKRRNGGRDRFRLMHSGEVELDDAAPAIASTFVDPQKGLSAIRKLEDTLSSLSGALKICDPHIENKTLDFLAVCSRAASISLLTVNIHRDTAFRRDLTAFRIEHSVPLDVRVAANPKLHDRYILHDNGLLMLGASLNGFAKKQSFVVALGPDMREMTERAFDTHWATASMVA